jgi:hypothetical protein
MRVFLVSAVALMTAINAPPAVAGERPKIEVELYDYVMEKVDDYALLNSPKVMASCIDWDASNEFGVYVHNVFTYHTGISSDRPIFASELARNAMNWCKKWAEDEKVGCTCQMLDKNGKNVLKAPRGK